MTTDRGPCMLPTCGHGDVDHRPACRWCACQSFMAGPSFPAEDTTTEWADWHHEQERQGDYQNPSQVRTVLESMLLGRRFTGGLSVSVIDEVMDRLGPLQELHAASWRLINAATALYPSLTQEQWSKLGEAADALETLINDDQSDAQQVGTSDDAVSPS